MRQITDHIVPGDSANHQLTITVTDAPVAGAANHRYLITRQDWTRAPDGSDANGVWDVIFQDGPIKEAGVNGVTQEVLLAIVIDRLRSFQTGPYACEANSDALSCCEEALNRLQIRTRERIARGVEGTHQV